MPARRVILHADVDAFFASVEQRDDPALRGRPVIAGGGVVMAASYEARRFGVRSGMGGSQARRLCPQALVVPSRFAAYAEASRELFGAFERAAAVVERMSIEEAFLDVSERARTVGEARTIAERLRADVRERLGLTVTVGGGGTKLVAKTAGRAAKPDGLLIVAPRDERAFLDPLRVEELWGIGPATAAKLHAGGLRTVGEAARLAEHELVAMLGRAAGRQAHALARNLDARAVEPDRPPRSFGAQSALGRTPLTPEQIDDRLARLAERVARRMATAGYAGRTVHLRLRFADYERASRAHTLAEATADPAALHAAAETLLAASRPAIGRRGLTLLGITVSNVVDGEQLALGLTSAGRCPTTWGVASES